VLTNGDSNALERQDNRRHGLCERVINKCLIGEVNGKVSVEGDFCCDLHRFSARQFSARQIVICSPKYQFFKHLEAIRLKPMTCSVEELTAFRQAKSMRSGEAICGGTLYDKGGGFGCTVMIDCHD